MPQCKAIKTFHSEHYGYIRAGTRFSSDKNYALQLRSRGLIQIIADENGPSRTQAFEGAPETKNEPPVLQPDKDLQQADSADQQRDGAEKQSALSRVGRVLQRPTAPTPKANAKR
jgi:hypothetical protein